MVAPSTRIAPATIGGPSGTGASLRTGATRSGAGAWRCSSGASWRCRTEGSARSTGFWSVSPARAALVRARDYVVVSPASRIRVPTFQQQGGSGLIQMITDAGTAMFRIQHQSVPHFGVQTPYLAAVVKGTVFTVTVGEHGASVQ